MKVELDARRDVLTLDAAAWAHWAAGELDQAYRLSTQAVAQGVPEPRVIYHAAVIAASAGADRDAEQHFQNAARLEQLLLPSERRHLRTQFAAFAAKPWSVAGNPGDVFSTTHRRKF